jgi:hypothetical protein
VSKGEGPFSLSLGLGEVVALPSISSIDGRSFPRLRCRTIYIFSPHPRIEMHPSAILRNGSNDGSTKHIASRVAGRLRQMAIQRGVGKKAVSIVCLDRTNRCQKNGRIFDKIRFALDWPRILRIGHINFNLTKTNCRPSLRDGILNELTSGTDALQRDCHAQQRRSRRGRLQFSVF